MEISQYNEVKWKARICQGNSNIGCWGYVKMSILRKWEIEEKLTEDLKLAKR